MLHKLFYTVSIAVKKELFDGSKPALFQCSREALLTLYTLMVISIKFLLVMSMLIQPLKSGELRI